MAVYYFFSGFDRERGFPPEIAASLREDMVDRKSLVFIASCPYGHEKTDFYQEINAAWFRAAGMQFASYSVVDDRKTVEECASLIAGASAVFLAGGTTLLQLTFLRDNGLLPALREFDGAVLGMSAGAVNMAKYAFYYADEHCDRAHIYRGIGLADLSVTPHFTLENRPQLEEEILPFSELIDIHALCDDSAIVVHDKARRYFGDVYLAAKGKLTKIH